MSKVLVAACGDHPERASSTRGATPYFSPTDDMMRLAMQFSANVEKLKPSATIAVSTLAKKLASEGRDILNLAGGEPDDSVTANLNALNKQAAAAKAPWELSFSFGRSLQGAPLTAWAGKSENTEAAALAFYTRAKLTGEARKGAA